MPSNLERLQAAYAAWGSTGLEALDLWRDLMSDDFHYVSIDDQAPGLSFAARRNGREDAIGYLTGIFEQWDMVYYRPATFVAEGDKIAMFGSCAYRNKATGRQADCLITCLWEFEGDHAVRMTEVFDTAKAAAAATM
jgi:ketosteroid isomerase-like protein